MNALEHVGALYVENQRLLQEYGNLLGLVDRAKRHEVLLPQIAVDLAAKSWSILPAREDEQK